MKSNQSIIFSLDQIDGVAQTLWGLRDQCSVYTFTGSLGAGKTTLVQAMLSAVGVKDLITSPTFTIVNTYTNQKKQRFFHFDLYRIKSLEEFQRGAFDEYLDIPDSWCFIEWPQVIDSLLTHKVCAIHIDHQSDEKRILTYTIKP
jgi:tRNA threonylcarbamoyladenosine biosynthesis protein TsaE